ncbi:MAG TPA: sigma-70 family RNA polymerase sigma factor [Tepidisphaeraceae bacterium]|jgi:RNA polymerase sigma-70 factor (ECF subfamily)|nr:sigma-70 family RNA polymerase sigma factor [Tepidisphaeraceae bacterium]
MDDLADRLYLSLLVVRCQTGDRIALEELIARWQPRLRGFLHKMVSEIHGVDDLAQEVWLDVFRDLPRLENPQAFVPWLYRVARNRAFRALRRKPQTQLQIEDVEITDEADSEPEFGAEDARAVHQALDQLSPEHREVLLLRFMENMSYEDIARVVGCPLGTVRSRVHNAKHQLRVILKPQVQHESK